MCATKGILMKNVRDNGNPQPKSGPRTPAGPEKPQIQIRPPATPPARKNHQSKSTSVVVVGRLANCCWPLLSSPHWKAGSAGNYFLQLLLECYQDRYSQHYIKLKSTKSITLRKNTAIDVIIELIEAMALRKIIFKISKRFPFSDFFEASSPKKMLTSCFYENQLDNIVLYRILIDIIY